MKNNFYKQFPVILIIFLSLFLSNCGMKKAAWPAEGWEKATPESQGMDSEKLANMLDFTINSKILFDTLLIIRNGYIVLDATVPPYSADTEHFCYSVTKSVVSALWGIAGDKNNCTNPSKPIGLDRKVIDLFPEKTFQYPDSRKSAITVRNLFTMTTGLRFRDAETVNVQHSSDWVQYILDQPMIKSPGEEFRYNNGASHLLSVIIQKQTCMKTVELADKYLFKPLGITRFTWLTADHGATQGYKGLFLRPLDLAKIGYLYLRDGQWDGKQIIPSGWVKESSRAHVPVAESGTMNLHYGYQWWVNPDLKYYFATGSGGQFLFCHPEKDLVVVFTSSREQSGKELILFNQFILPAVLSDTALPENPDAQHFLSETINQISTPLKSPVKPLPGKAREISGKKISFESTDGFLENVRFAFTGETAEVSLDWNNLHLKQAGIGLDNVYRTSTDGKTYAVALRGYWSNEDMFVMELINFLWEDGCIRLVFSFKDPTVLCFGTWLATRHSGPSHPGKVE
ncbi:MAG: serine hydrolase [Spirochaetales bacterium]|nr:serine hydrolase [Spirochaetales bacterium]